MIDYDDISRFNPVTKQGMKCVERELCSGPKTTKQLQVALADNGLGSSVRNVQQLIATLNKIYGNSGGKKGDNQISRAPLHRLQDTEANLAFPELAVNSSDRKVIAKLLRLVNIFDGAIPVKRILEVSGVVDNGFDAMLNEMSDNADVVRSKQEAMLMAGLYDAIANRYTVKFRYEPLSRAYYGDVIHLSPYYLKTYNNKWFLIGHVENQPRQMGKGFNYPWSVFPLQRILTQGGAFFRLEKSDKPYRDIDRQRIRNYYSHVMGYYVPVEKDAPFVEELHPELIEIEAKDDRTFRYIMENPIHQSQNSTPEQKRNHRLTIDVIESPALYSKLLWFGTGIEVIQPEQVRAELHRQLTDAAQIYELKQQ